MSYQASNRDERNIITYLCEITQSLKATYDLPQTIFIYRKSKYMGKVKYMNGFRGVGREMMSRWSSENFHGSETILYGVKDVVTVLLSKCMRYRTEQIYAK